MLRVWVLLTLGGSTWAQQYLISTLAGGVPPPTPAAATTASIGDPPRVAVDSVGNLYFASVHSVFKVDSSGTLTRVAGTGRYGSSGDGGPGTRAQLAFPEGVAVDAAGNVFVSDHDTSAVRRISPDGVIATIAGNGTAGFSGDGSMATLASLNLPTGLAVDAAGNLYVADTGNNRVRKISAGGAIGTVAGTGEKGYTGDGGPAIQADLNGPEGVAVDAAGNLYIADTFNSRIRKVAPDGTITTFAANGYPGYSGDNGPATGAALLFPTDVAVDRGGTVYIADLGGGRIRAVANGIIRTVAGFPEGLPPADGLLAVSAALSGPTGLAVNARGELYLAEGSVGSGSGLAAGDFRVWKVGLDGVLSTAAGDGHNSYSGDNGPAAIAQLDTPAGVAVDAAGNVYVADSVNHRVRRFSPSGDIVTVAGYGYAGFSGDGGPASSALLNQPLGVAMDAAGHLYIADTGNNRIRMVSADGTISTVAGNGNAALFGDGGMASSAALHAPRAVAVDAAGNLYIADTLDNRVRMVTTDGAIHTIVGGAKGFGGDGGPAAAALLNTPSSVALDAAGNLYIADQGNARIRKVSPNGTIITVAGSDSASGLGDGGPAADAQLAAPRGVALDRAGNIYISDAGQNRVREVTADGIINTVAGNGECCYDNDGGRATAAELNAPWGVALDAAGNVYFADTGNQAVRMVRPAPAGTTRGPRRSAN